MGDMQTIPLRIVFQQIYISNLKCMFFVEQFVNVSSDKGEFAIQITKVCNRSSLFAQGI